MSKILKIFKWQIFVYFIVGWIIGGCAGVFSADYKLIAFGIVFFAVAYFIIDKIIYSVANKK